MRYFFWCIIVVFTFLPLRHDGAKNVENIAILHGLLDDYNQIEILLELGCFEKAKFKKNRFLKKLELNYQKMVNKLKDKLKKNIITEEELREEITHLESSKICIEITLSENEKRLKINTDFSLLVIRSHMDSVGKDGLEEIWSNIGQYIKVDDKNFDGIYFPLGKDYNFNEKTIKIAYVVKQLLEQNNIPIKIFFTDDKSSKDITIAYFTKVKQIKYSEDESLFLILDEIMFCFYSQSKPVGQPPK